VRAAEAQRACACTAPVAPAHNNCMQRLCGPRQLVAF